MNLKVLGFSLSAALVLAAAIGWATDWVAMKLSHFDYVDSTEDSTLSRRWPASESRGDFQRRLRTHPLRENPLRERPTLRSGSAKDLIKQQLRTHFLLLSDPRGARRLDQSKSALFSSERIPQATERLSGHF